MVDLPTVPCFGIFPTTRWQSVVSVRMPSCFSHLKKSPHADVVAGVGTGFPCPLLSRYARMNRFRGVPLQRLRLAKPIRLKSRLLRLFVGSEPGQRMPAWLSFVPWHTDPEKVLISSIVIKFTCCAPIRVCHLRNCCSHICGDGKWS